MSSKVPVHGGDDDVLSLCVLITREDYLQYAAQLRREQRRGHLPFITGGGAVLVFLGLAGLFFGSAMTSAAETQSLFSIAVGREVRILSPKRLLGEEECLRLRDWLSSGKKEA